MKKNIYQEATFLTSVVSHKGLPKDDNLEIAFAGRSNVGKSSIINALTDQTKLAKTSKTPGRTQMINYFSLPNDRYLVDLPGYGFAKVPRKVKVDWQKNLEDYFKHRHSLQATILIMDIRHPLKEYDQMMLEWLQSYEIPVHVILNKADKLSRNQCMQVKAQVAKQLGQNNTSIQLFSVLKKQGVEELVKVIDSYLQVAEDG